MKRLILSLLIIATFSACNNNKETKKETSVTATGTVKTILPADDGDGLSQ